MLSERVGCGLQHALEPPEEGHFAAVHLKESHYLSVKLIPQRITNKDKEETYFVVEEALLIVEEGLLAGVAGEECALERIPSRHQWPCVVDLHISDTLLYARVYEYTEFIEF